MLRVLPTLLNTSLLLGLQSTKVLQSDLSKNSWRRNHKLLCPTLRRLGTNTLPIPPVLYAALSLMYRIKTESERGIKDEFRSQIYNNMLSHVETLRHGSVGQAFDGATNDLAILTSVSLGASLDEIREVIGKVSIFSATLSISSFGPRNRLKKYL